MGKLEKRAGTLNSRCFICALVCLNFVLSEARSQSATDTTFLDKLQKYIEIRRSFETESQAKNPALLSYKKSEDSKAVITVDIAVSYIGFSSKSIHVKLFLQLDFSGSSDKDKNELMTAGLSSVFFDNSSFKVKPEISYARDYFNRLNIYKAGITLNPFNPSFPVPLQDITKKKYNEQSIDGAWLAGLNPNINFRYRETDYEGQESNSSDFFASAFADFAVKHWYFQLVVSGLGERAFGDVNEYRYKYGATATLFFDEKERSSLNLRFDQRGSDLKQALRIFTLGFGLKL